MDTGRHIGRACVFALTLLSPFASGCGGGGASPDRYACQVDEALLAERRSCVADDQCPCGSHCALGLCDVACRSNSECASDQSCDAFGRCVDGNGNTFDPRLTSAPRGRLRLQTGLVDLDATHLAGSFVLESLGGPSGRVRIEAAPPLELRCDDTTPPSSECFLDDLLEGEPRAVHVALPSAPTEAAEYGVEVHGVGGMLPVHVRVAVEATPRARALEGVYRGFASIRAFGTAARTSVSDAPAEIAGMRIPVELRVFPESAGESVVAFSDELSMIFPEAETVGRLQRGSDGRLRLSHQARAFIQGEATRGPDISIEGVSSDVESGEGGIGFMWRASFTGLTPSASAPFIDFHFALGRVGDLPAGETAPAPSAPHLVTDAATRARTPLALEGLVAARQPALAALTPAERLQGYLCTPYDAATAVSLSPSVGGGWAGDLGCGASASGQLTFGLLRQSSWQIADTLGACMADLAAVQDVTDGTAAVGDGSGCVDGPRTLAALSLALDTDRRRALGEALPADATASALGHRLAAQWVKTLAFVARQATQVDRLNDVLAGEDSIDTGFSQTAMLARTMRGWDTLLDPRLSFGLNALNPSVLHAPDYRPRVSPGSYPPEQAHDQTRGLPVVLTEALRGTLGVYGALFERARFVPADREALEISAGRFLRRSLVLYTLATNEYLNMRANSATPPAWDADWQRSGARLGLAISALQRSVRNFRAGENPLDIDPKLDLPLYRIGDELTGSARFSALTDFLIGTSATGIDDSAIAPTRVIRAEQALNDARSAWASNLLRDFREEIQSTATDRRLEAIRRRYGESIASLCGDPSFDANSVLSMAGSIDADNCFIKPECRRSFAQRLAAEEPEDVAYNVCVADALRRELGSSAAGDVLATGFVPAEIQPILDGRASVRGHTGDTSRTQIELSTGVRVDVDSRILTYATEGALGSEIDGNSVIQMQQRCAAVANASAAARPALPPASCTLHGNCPSGYLCDAGSCAPVTGSSDSTACFMGAMGELAASMRTAALNIRVARSRLDELSQGYDIAMRACIVTKLGGERQIAALEAHNDTLRTLGAIKLAADIASNAAEATKDCADSVDVVDDVVTGGAKTAVQCGAAVAQQVAQSVSDGLQFGIEEAERKNAVTVAVIDAETDNARCVVEAEQYLVGTRTSTLEIEAASQELGRLLVEFESRKVDVRAALAEGQDALVSEMARSVHPMELEFWLDARVEEYDSAFRSARRAMYLSVLAVEYEYQLSSIEQQNVLAATRVADLRGVLDRLRDLTLTGSVGGSLPSNLSAVLSLRDNLLTLADQRALPAGWHRLDPSQRFRAWVTDARFAIYGRDGRYMGQEIPFSVVPNGQIGLGDTGGIPLLTGSDCAERLWSVNATLVGEALLGDSESQRTRMTIRKRNSFFSQWCDGRSPGEFQNRATRPSRNLFLDPFADYQAGMIPATDPQPLDAAAEADAYTDARLQPTLNTSRVDFEADEFTSGSSTELAGRGLYGDYTLFFPADVLARDGVGLDLSALDDVLVRFDYVSVAR